MQLLVGIADVKCKPFHDDRHLMRSEECFVGGSYHQKRINASTEWTVELKDMFHDLYYQDQVESDIPPASSLLASSTSRNLRFIRLVRMMADQKSNAVLMTAGLTNRNELGKHGVPTRSK